MALVNPNHPIHPSFDERISVKVEGQLPAFVKQDHATFVAFMEAYYEYMEQQGKPVEIIGNLINYANVDKSTDEFLNYFKKQFGKDIPEAVFANANKPFVLKHLRDFYRTKGSEKSFQFLFRLLYKEEIDFYYPGKDMLRTSDGKYNTSKIIRVVDTSGTDAVFTIVGKKITGATSGATAIVETVLNEAIGTFVVSTVFLSGTVGIFTDGEVISDGTSSFTTGGMITDYTITNPGNNYSLNSVVPVTGGGGSASGSFIRISELSKGSITSYTIVNGGSGYVVGDKLTIDNTDDLAIDGRTCSLLVKTVSGSGAITSLEFEHNGYGYTSIPTVTGGGSGMSCNITLSGTGVGGIKSLNIINGGFGYVSNGTFNFSSLGDGTATGTANKGAYEDSYQKGFIGNDGFLSAPKYIQDSHYYQLFSYVIACGYTIDNWRDTVKRVVHPAGLALFGNFEISSLLSTSLKITGIPQRRDYKIIFHSGTVPPVKLDLKVDSCSEDQNIVVWYPLPTDDQQESDSTLDNNNISSTEDDGTITQAGTQIQDDGSIVRKWYYKPTKCQIHEKELHVQYLGTVLLEDYEYVSSSMTTSADYGTLANPLNSASEDHGWIHDKTQLRLGPLRRTIDRQKFHKFGGFSQKIGVNQQSGPRLSDYQLHTTALYEVQGGLKTRNVMNATVTQYQNGAENTSLPPS